MPELNLILLGPPGAGKGTQGERLQEDFGLPYSRPATSCAPRSREGTELGAQGQGVHGPRRPRARRGDHRRDRRAARRPTRPRDGFILDGFPRTVRRPRRSTRSWTSSAAAHRGVLIDVPDEEVVRRLGGRRTCAKNGHIFHVEFDPPKNEGVCDIDGAG